MQGGAGETLLLGIALDFDPSGAIRGVQLVDQSLGRLKQKTERQAEDFSRTLQRTMQASAQAAGGALMVGLGATGAGEAMRRLVLDPMMSNAEDFGVELSRLQFVSGAVGQELEILRELALTTGVETQFSPTQAIGGLRRLRAAGLETNEAMRELRSALDLATASAGTLSLDQATLSTAAAIAQFRHQFRGAGEDVQAGRVIMDHWAQAARETAFDISEIPEVMRSLRGMANVWRVNSQEVFGLAGMLRSSGLQAADATQALTGMGRRFAIIMRQVRAAEQMGGRGTRRARVLVESFRRFGVDIFDPQTRQVRRLTDVITDLIDNYKDFGTDEEKITLLNTLLGQQASQLVSAGASYQRYGMEGSDAVRELIRRIGDGEGASRQAAASFETTIAGMKVFVVGSLQTIAVVLGQALAPAIRFAINVTREFVNGFLGFVRAHPKIAQVIAFLVLGFTLTSLAVGGFIVTLSGLVLALSMVAGSFASAATAGVTLAGVIAVLETLVLPLLLVVGALAGGMLAFVGGIVLLAIAYEKNLGGLKDFIDDWVSDIQLIWTALVDWFGSGQTSIATALKEQLEDRGLAKGFLFLTGFIVRVQEMWKSASEVMGGAWEIFVAVFSFALETVISGIDWLEETLASVGIKFDENMDFWRNAGKVLGVVLVAGVALLGFALGNLAVVLGVIGLALAAPIIAFIAIGALIALLVIGVIELVSWLGRAKDALVSWVSEVIKPFGALIEFFQILWAKMTAADAPWRAHVMPWVEQYIYSPIVRPLMRAFNELTNFLLETWMTISGIFSTAVGAILQVMAPIYSVILNLLTTVGTILVAVGTTIFSFFSGLVTKAFNAGKALVEAFKSGIRSVWSSLVVSFSENIAEIRDLLPHSDAVAGPLSTLTESGSSLWRTWLGGVSEAFPETITGIADMTGRISQIVSGDSPIQQSSPLGAAVEGATGSGSGSRSVTVNIGEITVTAGESTPEEAEKLAGMIIERISRQLEQQEEVTFS